MKILFIGKDNDHNARIASEYLKILIPGSIVIFGTRGQKFPDYLLHWKGDYVFSYLSPWIIPKTLLEGAEKGAINWHPGTPEYPGIGCTNFAIYNNEKEFGITCHYMLDKVDTGRIIEVVRFQIDTDDTVYSVTQKCYALILSSFFRILSQIEKKIPLDTTDENWKREPYTRKELDELSEIDPAMSFEEIEKRINATTFDRPWAFVNIKGKKFYYKE